MTQIYKITNLVNTKSYIGKTTKTFEFRFKEHIAESKRDRCKHRPLYRAFAKYGVENFKIELLEEVEENIACQREIYWINVFSTFKFGYNATLGGDAGSYVDKSQILELFETVGNIRKIAKILGCHRDTVSDYLKSFNIKPKPAGFTHRLQVVCSGVLGFEIDFESVKSAARYLIAQGFTDSAEWDVAGKISLCCRGTRKSAYGFKWRYKN